MSGGDTPLSESAGPPEAGVTYNKQRLHKVGYFRELLASSEEIDDGLRRLLRMCQETVVRLGKTESALVRSLQRDPVLRERIERLITIPAVGPITALTWVLEVGDVGRFSSIKKAIATAGLWCGEKFRGDHVTRPSTPSGELCPLDTGLQGVSPCPLFNETVPSGRFSRYSMHYNGDIGRRSRSLQRARGITNIRVECQQRTVIS